MDHHNKYGPAKKPDQPKKVMPYLKHKDKFFT